MSSKTLFLFLLLLIFLFLPTTSFGRSKRGTLKNFALLDSSCNCENIITSGENAITQDGSYTVTASIPTHISIQANKVKINLCGNTISYSNLLSENSVIEITPGHNNIEILNGKIEGNINKDGIITGSSCSFVSLQNLKIYSCNNGINFNGQVDPNLVKDCKVDSCTFKDCNKGIYLNYAKKITFNNCKALNCIEAGFDQRYCNFDVFAKCYALETANNSSTKDAIGFSSFAGQGNLFSECVAEGTTKSAGTYTNYDTRAIGFLLTGTEINTQAFMEHDTKIINSVANTTFVATSSCTAYGILLEPYLKNEDLSPVAFYTLGADTTSLNWSANGKYLARGGYPATEDDPEVRVFKFEDSSLSLIASYVNDSSGLTVVYSVNWSANGKYLALGSDLVSEEFNTFSVRVLRFDGSSLTGICLYDHGNYVYSVNWSPCGKYLAIGGGSGTNGDGGPTEVRVLKFDGSSLSFVTNYTHGADVNSVNWSPCGKYLAIGGNSGTNGDGGPTEVRVLKFDGSSLSFVTNYTHGNSISSVNWSPCGKYLTIGGASGTNGDGGPTEVRVLKFDGSSLSFVTNYTHGDSISSVNWSPCGKYLAIAGNRITGPDATLRILKFNGTTLSAEKNYDEGLEMSTVNWSSDNINLASATNNPKVFTIMDAPYHCLLKENEICNATSYLSTGTGFSRQAIGICASGDNLYIKNVGSYNDVNFNKAVYNVYGESLLTCNPKEFDNLSQPPYEACYGYSTCF